MPLRLPHLVLGRGVESEGVAVFPLFWPQAQYESDYLLGSELLDAETLTMVGVDVEEDGVLVRCEQVWNDGPTPLLLVAGDDLRKPWVFNTSFIVGPHSFADCPVLCVTDRSFLSAHSHLDHRKGAAGLVVCGESVFVNVFDSVQTCEKLWPQCLGMLAGRCVNKPTWQRGESLYMHLDEVPWEGVQGFGEGEHWITRQRGFRGDVLLLNGRLVHLSLTADWSVLRKTPYHKRHLWLPFPDE
jgi:hypothetical protein